MKWVISVSCHYVTSLEYNVLNTANTYDWMIATADSRINRRICAVIKIPVYVCCACV
jgi:rRNA-processing protein FCF1